MRTLFVGLVGGAAATASLCSWPSAAGARRYNRRTQYCPGKIYLILSVFALLLACGDAEQEQEQEQEQEPLFQSRDFTPPGSFTSLIEGPATDAAGNVYAVNFARWGTIGIVTPAGESSLFVRLPPGSAGSGIRLNSRGDLMVADVLGHNVLRVVVATKNIST